MGDWGGVEWRGVEWTGVYWRGVEWSGLQWSEWQPYLYAIWLRYMAAMCPFHICLPLLVAMDVCSVWVPYMVAMYGRLL